MGGGWWYAAVDDRRLASGVVLDFCEETDILWCDTMLMVIFIYTAADMQKGAK